MALTLMLRPSDTTPHSVTNHSGEYKLRTFSRSMIVFRQGDTVEIMLHGIKNYYSRDRFQVFMRRSSDHKMCPVLALEAYLFRTRDMVQQDGPVFLSLNKPYTPLSVTAVSNVLNKAIELAGLANQGFTAKSFRPSGATHAIEAGCVPDQVRSMGRCKFQPTFEEHYVHAVPSAVFSDKILLQS